jgi:hypothetical protein
MPTTMGPKSEGSRHRRPIRTTLYELIETLHTLIPPEDDHLVVATVAYLLHTGCLRYPARIVQNN